jgi:hypothetical protein
MHCLLFAADVAAAAVVDTARAYPGRSTRGGRGERHSAEGPDC